MLRTWRMWIAFAIVVAVTVAALTSDLDPSGDAVPEPALRAAATSSEVEDPELDAPDGQSTADDSSQWRLDDLAALDAITIEPEDDGGVPYERDAYDIYRGRDEHGCNLRDRILQEEALRLTHVDNDCNPEGEWYSWLDGQTITDEKALEIDHLVAFAKAHDSGAWRWDERRRGDFRNESDHPETMSAVSASVNRSKWAYDPAEWMPPLHSAWCRYARSWISVKLRWELTADQAEAEALAEMLKTCVGPPKTSDE